ncbi:hypothetical protein BBJ28_00017561 [Nothophytophthora sp. Chile5]|nr:hypothetical protein BBJ28_00017561 [Nothophytophthora sp. Chile5]
MLASIQSSLAASPLIVKLCAALGCLVASRVALKLLGSFYTFFLRPAKDLRHFGAWGVVTGATDGIGKAMAMELANKGLNVLLMSRTLQKLEDVRAEILAKNPTVQVEILVVDFVRIDDSNVRASIQKTLDRIQDVGVLVNNVGVAYDHPEFFDDKILKTLRNCIKNTQKDRRRVFSAITECFWYVVFFDQLDEHRMDSIIKLNITSASVLTRLVLRGMAQRKRGVIVNVGSASAHAVLPLLTGYSASKTYIEQFTLCLAEEYRAKNVVVQAHVPMLVATKLSQISDTTFWVPSPDTYARAAVANLGYETIIAPYWPHALQLWLGENAPTWLSTKVAMTTNLSLRESALKNLEAKKEQ